MDKQVPSGDISELDRISLPQVGQRKTPTRLIHHAACQALTALCGGLFSAPLEVFSQAVPKSGFIVRCVSNSILQAAIDKEDHRVAHSALGVFQKYLELLESGRREVIRPSGRSSATEIRHRSRIAGSTPAAMAVHVSASSWVSALAIRVLMARS